MIWLYVHSELVIYTLYKSFIQIKWGTLIELNFQQLSVSIQSNVTGVMVLKSFVWALAKIVRFPGVTLHQSNGNAVGVLVLDILSWITAKNVVILLDIVTVNGFLALGIDGYPHQAVIQEKITLFTPVSVHIILCLCLYRNINMNIIKTIILLYRYILEQY